MNNSFSIYIDSNLSYFDMKQFMIDTLKGKVDGYMSIKNEYFEVDITENSEFDICSRYHKPDGFLYFRYIIEFYPLNEELNIEYINLLLQSIWEKNIPAILASDFEHLLICNGGYKSEKIPWPIDKINRSQDY